jgi:ATP phosphoribosyltransferase
MPFLIMRRILSSFRPLMQMGTADAILDLVSSGTTLRENNLKEISGGSVLSSQGVFVANKRALLERKEVLDTVHELLERFEAHLTAQSQFTVVANMRGSSPEEVAERILNHTNFPGLQVYHRICLCRLFWKVINPLISPGEELI